MFILKVFMGEQKFAIFQTRVVASASVRTAGPGLMVGHFDTCPVANKQATE